MSKRIPNDEWLHLAKGTGIGSQRRVQHGRERDAAMTVGNTGDRWWAYCQRCKAGAVETKSHVYAGLVEPKNSRDLSLPTDALPITALPIYEQQNIAGFLASKGMDLEYLTGCVPTWSRERQRLLLHTPSGVMGRDTSGRSSQKWLTYDRQHWITDLLDATRPFVILTEDCFSWAKLQRALVLFSRRDVSVFCTLGTAIHDNLMLHMLRHNKRVASMYDGDAAGWKGASENSNRLLGCGLCIGGSSDEMCAPPGKDPKDMTLEQLATHAYRLFANF